MLVIVVKTLINMMKWFFSKENGLFHKFCNECNKKEIELKTTAKKEKELKTIAKKEKKNHRIRGGENSKIKIQQETINNFVCK